MRRDDLDRADTRSLRALRRALADLPRPVVLVATSSPLDGAPELGRTVSALKARGRAVEVTLGALTREAVADLLAQLLTERPTTRLLDMVTAKTGGNPGAIVQLVHDLSTSGRLTVVHNGVEGVTAEAARPTRRTGWCNGPGRLWRRRRSRSST